MIPFISSSRAILAALIIAIALAAPCSAQISLIYAYPLVDSMSRFPVQENNLIVLCKKKIAERYITFVGEKGSDKVLLVAITLEPIADVKKDISLSVQFKGITPAPGKVQTWGYIYDRNRDGKVDYLALQSGAAPFWDSKMPKYYPPRNAAVDNEQMEILVNHSNLVFNHWADDNYDGKLDGVIHVDMFRERDWVKRRLVVRSTKYNNNYDDVTSFRTLPGDIEDSIEVYDDGVPYYPIGSEETEMIGKSMFDDKSNILALINLGVEQCNLGNKLQAITRKTAREE